MIMTATQAAAPAAGAPAIGLHQDVPAEVYHSWPGASNSRLSTLLRSPAHLKAELDSPSKPETPAQLLGTAIHYAVLEPDLFTGKYVRNIEGDGRTKAVKEAREALIAEHPFATILSAADYDTCIKARDSVHRHPAAKIALSGEGMTEVSMVWDDPETGVRCKARADRLNLELGAVVDLKSTRDAREPSFSRDIFNYGYHRQGSLYTGGASLLLGVEIGLHIIIALEKEGPCAAAVYRLRDDALFAGRQELDVLLRRYDTCLKTDHWPAYSNEFQDISLPTWAWSQIDERTEQTDG